MIEFQQKHFSREEYIKACKEAFEEFNKKHRVLIQYVNRKKNRWATIVSFMANNQLYIGISKCNFKHDIFNKHIGIINAINNASAYSKSPLYTKNNNKIFHDILTRSIVYFRFKNHVNEKWRIIDLYLDDKYKIENWPKNYPELFV